MTQIEQLKQAKRAYIIVLNQRRTRFAVYLDSGKGLEVLWPEYVGGGRAADPKSLLSGQVHTERRDIPAYHFHLTGCGYSKVGDVREELRRHNPKLEVYTLDGWQPASAH